MKLIASALVYILVLTNPDEYVVLIDFSGEEISKIVDPKITEVIIQVKEGKVIVMLNYS